MAPAQTSDTVPEHHALPRPASFTVRSGYAARSIPTGRSGTTVLDELPLIGCVVTVAVADNKRRGELSALFTRRGAKVLEAAATGLAATGKGAAGEAPAERSQADRLALDRLVGSVVRREVHAICFTTASDVAALLEGADAAGLRDELLAALNGDVTAVCPDPLCARPLELLGVTPLRPERARPGAMVSALCTALPLRIRREIQLTSGRTMVLQGFAAVIDDTASVLPPLPAAVLAELARQPGWVVSRADLLRRVWAPRGVGADKRDEHAVEATIARLRAALGPNAALVKTVIKRGYRLPVDGEAW